MRSGRERRRASFWLTVTAAVAILPILLLFQSADAPSGFGAHPKTESVKCGYGSFRPGHWPSACWRPYAASSPFNTRVPARPRVLPNSAQIVAKVLSMGPAPDLVAGLADTKADWYHPIYYSQPGDPVYRIHCTKPWGRCAIEGQRVQIPAAARPSASEDGHLAVISQTSGWEYDFWQVQRKPPNGGTLTVGWGGRTRVEGSGTGSGATGTGFGLAAGIIRAPELRAGQIDHALFLVVGCTSAAAVYPADSTGTVCRDPHNAPAGGQQFWLDMTDAQINATTFPPWKRAILLALAHYGAYVGDTGGNESIGLEFESGSSYTSFGYKDPMVTLAAGLYTRTESPWLYDATGIKREHGRYFFDWFSGVDWSHRLRVLAPCVGARTCG